MTSEAATQSLYKEDKAPNDSLYRRVERKYKFIPSAKQKPIDMTDVMDFALGIEGNSEKNREIMIRIDKEYAQENNLNLKAVDEGWEVWGLRDFPGFYVVRQCPLTCSAEASQYWIRKCLEEYPEPPNVTNLKALYGPVSHIWRKAQEPEATEAKKNADQSVPGPRKLLEKMVWCTLGYQYNWTLRRYDDALVCPFPSDFGELATKIADYHGFKDFRPEAGIVNYYHKKQSMGGHLDDAEYEMTRPIVSLSFANSCIFILGGETKDIEPVPILLRNGDLMLMGGRARFCYHGVARILENTMPEFLTEQGCPEPFRPFAAYLAEGHRVNMNARQVYEYDESGQKIRRKHHRIQDDDEEDAIEAKN